MQFRVVWYHTKEDCKYIADCRHEYLCDKYAAWTLWHNLVKVLGFPHVEVYNLEGTKQNPEEGCSGLTGYNI